jgi:hypothetical protein
MLYAISMGISSHFCLKKRMDIALKTYFARLNRD